MKFDQILGKCDKNLIREAEERLTSTFTELALPYDSRIAGSRLGGDVFIHQMVSPYQQICDARAIEFDTEVERIKAENKDNQQELIDALKIRLGKNLLRTAGTDGIKYYWAPQFVVKKSKIGLRLLVGHEVWHAVFSHPTRRGTRKIIPWNTATDFKINFNLMEDLRARGFYYPDEVFSKELGDFILLDEYSQFLRDPFNPPAKMALFNPIVRIKQILNPNIEYDNVSLYFAEPKLPANLRQPEAIYDYLIAQIPKCKCCGRVGHYKKPFEYKKLEQQMQEMLKDQLSDGT